MAMDESSLMRGRIIVAYDANRERNANEFKHTINGIRLRGDIIRGGDTIMVLGVLHRVLHPFGYYMQISPDNFAGNKRMVEEEVSKRVDMHVNMLLQSAEDCKDQGVDIEVNIVAGTPIRKLVLQEATTSNGTWLILDRHLRRDLQYYLKHVPCKIAVVLDNLTVDVLRGYTATIEKNSVDHEVVSSMCKPVPLSSFQEHLDTTDNQQSVISISSYSGCATSLDSIDRSKNTLMPSLSFNRISSIEDYRETPKQGKSGRHPMGEKTCIIPSPMIQKNKRTSSQNKSSDAPFVCVACEMKTEMYIKESMRFSYSEIQLATDDFSKENLLGEGGYGHVYKGELKDGQLIAAKVRKESSAQGFKEFNSEVYVLSFARHKNIVMLLGYCCKENINILVYEYICNKSLEHHLFDKTENVLEWHQRRAIAIGTAKGLRFLHEECRSSPIIHRDLRPSNILLTHEYVPMLGDFGLAKWKMGEGPTQTRILGTFGYLAPEYAENGIVSVRTDVYAFGITLIQLISGRKALDSDTEDNQKSLRQWAEPLIERLALHQLTDPRLGDAYDTYELYHMARAAYLCVKTDPEMRPSMGEVVRLLEGENDHLKSLVEQFIPHFSR